MSTDNKTHKKTRYGFSLLEMMVVLAITGMILVIAVPNYQAYQGRSRQNEARAGLSQIYAAEQTFAADTSTFTYCLNKIGFDPSTNLTRYYAIGLHSGASATSLCGKSQNRSCSAYTYSGTSAIDTCSTPDGYFSQTAKVFSGFNLYSNVNSVLVPYGGATMSRFIFTAAAAGNILGKNSSDRWLIDQDKNIVNISSGL